MTTPGHTQLCAPPEIITKFEWQFVHYHTILPWHHDIFTCVVLKLAFEDTVTQMTWHCRTLQTSVCTGRRALSTGQKYVLLVRGGKWLLAKMTL
jgi:hypothetical protein